MNEQEFQGRLSSAEAGDSRRARHQLFRARSDFVKQLEAESADPDFLQRARFEAMLLGPMMQGTVLPAAEAYREELKSQPGVAFAVGLVTSDRSPQIRAMAGWFLWIAGPRDARRHAAVTATSFVAWADDAVRHALETSSSSVALGASEALRAAAHVVRVTGQDFLSDRLLDAAIDFALKSDVPELARWRLDLAQLVTCFSRPRLRARASKLEQLSVYLRAGADAERAARFQVHIGFLRADIALRTKLGLSESDTHGRRSVAASFEGFGMETRGLRGVGPLRSAAKEFAQLDGCDQDVLRVNRELESRLVAGRDEMKRVPLRFSLSKEQFEGPINPYRGRGPAESLAMLACDPEFQINVEALAASSAEHDEEFVFRRMIPTMLFEGDGTTVRPGDEEGQKRMRLLNDAVFQQRFHVSLYVRRIFEMLNANGMTVNQLWAQLAAGSLFDESDRPFMEAGLRHWLAGCHLSALSVLVPRTEGVLRRALTRLGGTSIVAREDSDQRAVLSTVLKKLDEHAGDVHARSVFFELGVYLDGGGGLSVRHQVAHGLADAEFFSKEKVDTLVFLLLRLSALGLPVGSPGPNLSGEGMSDSHDERSE